MQGLFHLRSHEMNIEVKDQFGNIHEFETSDFDYHGSTGAVIVTKEGKDIAYFPSVIYVKQI
jgi:hypothetical protein